MTPKAPTFSLVYSWAVFERLPKDLVASYLAEFARVLRPGGRTAVYFLRQHALETGFSNLLGDDVYVFWEPDELRALHARLGLTVRHVLDWPNAWVVVAEKPAADTPWRSGVHRKGRAPLEP